MCGEGWRRMCNNVIPKSVMHRLLSDLKRLLLVFQLVSDPEHTNRLCEGGWCKKQSYRVRRTFIYAGTPLEIHWLIHKNTLFQINILKLQL